MSRTYRVVVADDHEAARAGVRAALPPDRFDIVADVGDAPSAVRAALAEAPDLCLLDVHMPGGGIAAAREISASSPGTAIVMLTVSMNEEDFFDALRAGASGYLLKDTDPLRLPAALEGVLAGEAAIPRTLVSRLVDEFRSRGRQHRVTLEGERGALLTSREWEVLELLSDGLSTRAIAERLFLSEATVRSHVAAVLRKLHVPDRDSAIRLVNEQRVVTGRRR